jgi:hypothetical protein
MSAPWKHYVCDRCGNYWTWARETEACPACYHTAVWEFARKQPALDHAAGIRLLSTKATA